MRDICLPVCNTQYAIRNTKKAFTLTEVMTALVILAIVSSSVLVVINHCVASAADSALRMQAFEAARNNMEQLLSSASVEETADYGDSDKYPGIKWQTVVETFYEPITARMWVRAVCSAEYTDSTGETQTIELTHWLTDVTKEQLLQIMEQQDEQQQEQEWLADHIIETTKEAAEYADVDEQTIQQWVDNGMLTTEDGSFIKANLDLYKQTGGNPSDEQKKQQVTSILQLLDLAKTRAMPGQIEATGGQKEQDNIDPVTGLTYEELEKMNVSEIFNLLKGRNK
jgi:prepilin-type N-terminal cleavage/methylation domain-containing protein